MYIMGQIPGVAGQGGVLRFKTGIEPLWCGAAGAAALVKGSRYHGRKWAAFRCAKGLYAVEYLTQKMPV